jgi:hypothetical protein
LVFSVFLILAIWWLCIDCGLVYISLNTFLYDINNLYIFLCELCTHVFCPFRFSPATVSQKFFIEPRHESFIVYRYGEYPLL